MHARVYTCAGRHTEACHRPMSAILTPLSTPVLTQGLPVNCSSLTCSSRRRLQAHALMYQLLSGCWVLNSGPDAYQQALCQLSRLLSPDDI